MRINRILLVLLLVGFSSCQRVKIVERQYTVDTGENVKIVVQGAVDPNDLAWYSAQPNIAKVNKSGVVSGISKGSTYIRMVLSANEQLLDSVKIIVQKP